MNETDSRPKRASIRDDLIIDIYANPAVDGLAILIDRPFKSPLLRFELNIDTKDLIFVFKDEKKDLGMPLKDQLVPFFTRRGIIEVYQVDMKTKDALDGWRVPLKIIAGDG